MFGVSRFNSARRVSRTGAIILGGIINGGQTASIQKFYFSAETGATIGTHSSTMYGAWGATHVGNAGYTLAGYGYSGETSYAVQDDAKILYATNSVSSLGSPYGDATKVNDSHGSDSGTKSLSFSGYDKSIPGWSSAGKRWTFSTDSASTTSATMSSARGNTFTLINSSTAMYVHGGSEISNYYCDTNIVDKITFATESRSSFYITSSKQRDMPGHAISNSGTAGYSVVGFDGNCASQANGVGTTEKLSFVTETSSILQNGLWPAGQYPNSFGNQGVAGYTAGARDSVTVYKLNFSTDVHAQISGTMGNTGSWAGNMVDSLGN